MRTAQKTYYRKKWVSLCCTVVGVEWVTFMAGMLNDNSSSVVYMYHCIRKTILSAVCIVRYDS